MGACLSYSADQTVIALWVLENVCVGSTQAITYWHLYWEIGNSYHYLENRNRST